MECTREEGRREGYAACQADVVAWLKYKLQLRQIAFGVEHGRHAGVAGGKR